MNDLEKLYQSIMKKNLKLDSLKKDEQKNKEKIIKLEKEIKTLKNSIHKLEEEKMNRFKKIRNQERQMPSELLNNYQYRSLVSQYIQNNPSNDISSEYHISDSLPYIGDVIVTDNGNKVIFKYGGIPEIDDGKKIIQFKNGSIYIYEEQKIYNFDTRENLCSMQITVKKTDTKGREKEQLKILANCEDNKWTCIKNENENEIEWNKIEWNEIKDISELPIASLKYSVSYDLGQFLIQNYTPIPKKEEKIPEKIDTELQEDSSIKDANSLTIEDLKKKYDSVYDPIFLLDNNKFICASQEDANTQSIIEHLFFKKKNGVVIPIPELTHIMPGFNISDRKRVTLRPTRNDSHAFTVEEVVNTNCIKYYGYVTLDDSQKIVKVFETEHEPDCPHGTLYHRYKDENGKPCIRLVDLEGNVHSIKENGKAGEKGLKEKTFGSRGDCQLKVVYKDKEPVYAFFLGNVNINSHEFCTKEELNKFFEIQTQNFKRFGWSMAENSCFNQMKDVIDSFNETFMQGSFVPSTDEVKAKAEDKSLTDLSTELSELTITEEKAKQLLQQYENTLSTNTKGEISIDE